MDDQGGTRAELVGEISDLKLRIRKLEQATAAPGMAAADGREAVALFGARTREIRAIPLDLAFSGFLQKPCRLDELKSVLGKVLG